MWTPPPVMLRPLGVGERIDAAFKIWTRNFLPMAKAMLVIAVPAGIIEALISLSIQPSATTTQIGGTTLTTSSSDGASVLGGSAANLVIGLFVAALSITTLFRIVGNAYLGQPVDWREALRTGLRRMLSAVWISILIGVAVAAILVVVVLFVVVDRTAGAPAAAITGVVLGLLAIGLIVWFTTGAHLATPVLMLENVRGAKAIRRGVRLVRGTWWSVFGTVVLMTLIVAFAGGLIGALFAVVIVAGHGDPVTDVISNFFLHTITLVVFTPLSAALYVVLTIDMRVRKEGFDIEFLAATMGSSAGPGALSFIRPPSMFPPGPYGPPGQFWPGGPPGRPWWVPALPVRTVLPVPTALPGTALPVPTVLPVPTALPVRYGPPGQPGPPPPPPFPMTTPTVPPDHRHRRRPSRCPAKVRRAPPTDEHEGPPPAPLSIPSLPMPPPPPRPTDPQPPPPA